MCAQKHCNTRATKSHDGKLWPSALHCSVYETLLLMQRAGEIRDIRSEVKINICGRLNWKVDFVVFDIKRDCDVAHEAKGREFPRYQAQIQAWEGTGPMDVCIWKGSWRRPVIVKTVKGKQ